MNDYKIIKAKYGYRYMKGAKFVKKADVPEEVLATLQEPEPIVELSQVPYKECLFCGADAKYTRFVNLKIVYLCLPHYYEKNMGQTAQKLNDLMTI